MIEDRQTLESLYDAIDALKCADLQKELYGVLSEANGEIRGFYEHQRRFHENFISQEAM